MSAPLLEMTGIDMAFGGVAALRSARLTLRRGEVHALIGQNGAGKSTLIKILTGVYTKDTGDVLFDGQPAEFDNPRGAQAAGISTIYQELNLIALRTVTENVCLGYEPRKWGLIDWSSANARAREILTRFGIDVDVTRPLGEYSTAVQQLVAIARAVSLDAKLVIMDEPTSSLDDREIEILFGVVRELRQAGVAVLYISHFLEELFQICDRVTVMRDGETVAEKTIEKTTKLGLIADMLGRDIEEIRAEGMTDFAPAEAKAGDVILEAKHIATGNRLRDFCVKVHRGEIVGLGGLLGSGRTEAARALFGVDELTQGEISLGGKLGVPPTPRRAIEAGLGYLTEDRKAEGIIQDMSVRENITLALLPQLTRAGRVRLDHERALVERYVRSLGIKTSNVDQPIRELSGGNQQKVLLARWLATEPELLILDEPTRGVDVGAKLEIQTIIRRYVEQGFGVVLISSEFEELVEGADRIVVLRDGHSVTELQNPGVTENTLVAAIAHHEPTTDLA